MTAQPTPPARSGASHRQQRVARKHGGQLEHPEKIWVQRVVDVVFAVVDGAFAELNLDVRV